MLENKKGSILRIILKRGVRFCGWKEGFNSVSLFRFKKNSILWVILKKRFNSLNHTQKEIQIYESKKKFNSMSHKKSFNSKSHLKRFNSLSHIAKKEVQPLESNSKKVQFFESYWNTRKVELFESNWKRLQLC